MNTFKNTVEQALKTILEGLTYNGERILDNVVVGYNESMDPDNLSLAVVDVKPVLSGEVKTYHQRRVAIVNGTGNVNFFFKEDYPGAEDMNDYIPSLFFQHLLDHPTLDGDLKGRCNPIAMDGALYEMDNRSGRFYKSVVDFELKNCHWTRPTE